MNFDKIYQFFILFCMLYLVLGLVLAVLQPIKPNSNKLNVFGFDDLLWGVGLLLASYALQMLITPKQDAPDKATLDDFDFPQFEEGTPQAICFGDCWTEDFFVGWYGNLRTSSIKSSSSKK